MKEYPIIFNTDMVKAILDGTKTQTRRVIKPQPPIDYGNTIEYWLGGRDVDHLSFCPYGQVGQRLWVRETCVYTAGFNAIPCWVVYKDEAETWKWVDGYPNGVTVYRNDKPEVWKWRPSIHMHKFASRITLEITEVRVERVQEISPVDTYKEGVAWPPLFKDLWDSLYAKRGYGWEVNPWVWVISFKKVS